jgi:integrase/recombinase XerC/integrase/recombinase XerD
MSQLQETNKPVSVHCYFRAVRRFFNWSMVEKIIEVNPMSVIRPPRVPEKVIIPFSDDDIFKMVNLCDARNWFIDRRNKAIILTFLDSGLRLLEMFNVKLADVDLGNGSILVMGKGAKQRFVPISHVTSKAIMSYLYMRSDKYPNMWLSEERVPLKSPNSIQQMIGTIAKRAGVTGVRASPHTFRHTFGTRTLENGANVFQVKALLGHATLDMTRKYSASLDSRQAVEAHHGTAGRKGFSPVENMKLR